MKITIVEWSSDEDPTPVFRQLGINVEVVAAKPSLAITPKFEFPRRILDEEAFTEWGNAHIGRAVAFQKTGFPHRCKVNEWRLNRFSEVGRQSGDNWSHGTIQLVCEHGGLASRMIPFKVTRVKRETAKKEVLWG